MPMPQQPTGESRAVYYQIAAKFDGGSWRMVSTVIRNDLYVVISYLKAYKDLYPTMVVLGSGNVSKLFDYLRAFVDAKPGVYMEGVRLLAEQKFDVLTKEMALGSWLLREAEEYLEAIQRDPFHETTLMKIERRLLFYKWLYRSGVLES